MRRTLHKTGMGGCWTPVKNIIEVQMNTKDYPVAKDIQDQTFCHEWVHAALDYCQYPELSKDEDLVDRMGQALHQLLKENYDLKKP